MSQLKRVALIVPDYDAAIRFFVDVLQFELVEDSPSLTNDGRPKRWVVVQPEDPREATSRIGLQRFVRVTPPVVHQMIETLEARGFIVRQPGAARSIRLRLTRAELPDLEQPGACGISASGEAAGALPGYEPAAGDVAGDLALEYLRHAFFATRTFVDVDDLNAQFRRWPG